MFSKRLDKSAINKILVISLTNIGDVILTFPVIDILKNERLSVRVSVVIGPKAKGLFKNNPHLDKIHIYDKHQSPLRTISWVRELRREHFDLVVDLRNSAVPFMIAPRSRTSPFVDKSAIHMKEKHLARLKSIFLYEKESPKRYALFIPPEDRSHVDQLLKNEMEERTLYAVVAPGAANRQKRWTSEGFRTVCDQLISLHGFKVVFVGDENDKGVVQEISGSMKNNSVNFCGRLSLLQLAAVLERSAFCLTNDSAAMHLASYLQRPVLAVFGPSDPQKYGPWSPHGCFVRNAHSCPACQQPKEHQKHICMDMITSDDVLNAFKFSDNRIVFPRK